MNKLIIILLAVFIVGCGSGENQNKTAQNPMTSSPTSEAELQKAFDYLEKGDIARAISKFDQIIKKSPGNTDNYLILGQVYLRLNTPLKAIDTLTAATKIDPNNGEAYYLLAIANGLAQRKESAIDAAQKSSEIYLANREEDKLKRSLALLKSLQEADFQDGSVQ